MSKRIYKNACFGARILFSRYQEIMFIIFSLLIKNAIKMINCAKTRIYTVHNEIGMTLLGNYEPSKFDRNFDIMSLYEYFFLRL